MPDINPFPDIKYKGAVFTAADMSMAHFSGVNLTGATFYALLENAHFSDCSLENTQFEDTNMSGVRIHNADLAESSISSANLTNASITNANLANVKIENVNLTGMTIDGILVSDLIKAFEDQKLLEAAE